MRSLLVTAAVVIATSALGGCHPKHPQPVPGPQSALLSAPAHARAAHNTRTRRYEVSEISWFQGTLEEAFSRQDCPHRRSLLRF
ncbi:MAG TPA: hypothetical protein VK803_06110 [Steroidobacteraceae bacterium]|jgi:hypothetical protein|nr:hypothetical protein [Steroidobacteraceae bacterium]